MKPKTSFLNRLKTVRTLAALSLASLVTAAAFAEGSVRYEAVPNGNKCTIAGTSTVHDWTMDSKIISGFIEADEKFPESALTDAAAAKPKTTVSIPVRSFKSGKSAMDDKMQVSMDATKFTKIEYRLIELKPKSKAGATGKLEFEATGALTIIGNTVTNTMPVTIEKKGTNIVVIGSAPIKMTHYKMKPPVITLLGVDALSVGDDLKITFEWRLAKKTKPEPTK
ncbi:MAG: YceI family protein [Verrucomicrobia bacterium]|jgi:polyisoprenoid-binding protein YceI|nr:MAG: YceI family protein [Verrucomicrobiota bacterium]